MSVILCMHCIPFMYLHCYEVARLFYYNLKLLSVARALESLELYDALVTLKFLVFVYGTVKRQR